MRNHRLGPLGIRFAAAFVGVALLAIAVFAIAMLIADQSNVRHLAATDREHAAATAVTLVENSYQSAGGWTGADLRPVSAFANQVGIIVQIKDRTGAAVMTVGPSGSLSNHQSETVTQTVWIGGKPVGSVAVGFPNGGVTPTFRPLSHDLRSAVGWSAAVAVLGALIVGVLVARGVVQPIRRLSSAVRSLRLGDSTPRVGPRAGPGELGELGRAFDAMAASLEREDYLRRALVADVAHELRTPVAIMQAETEALADGIASPTIQTLNSLHEEAVRLGRMVEDLQTLASAHAAGLELHPCPLDLGRVAADAADSLTSRFRAGGVELEQELPPTAVMGDANRLHQVAANLLSNAAKFTPAGGRVTLRTFTDATDGVLEVSDTGPGIPEGERDRVWDRFYRGSAGRLADGSGIGLAVVKELVDAHGATVSIEAPEGGGTRFVVRFPAAGLDGLVARPGASARLVPR
jgi:two-component system, OmpR family, sensor histidine kinase BaeS